MGSSYLGMHGLDYFGLLLRDWDHADTIRLLDHLCVDHLGLDHLCLGLLGLGPVAELLTRLGAAVTRE
jgi:hypothetical protein